MICIKFGKDGVNFYQAVDDFEKIILQRALEKTEWNMSRAAKMLRLRRSTLATMCKKKGLDRPDGK
jgi:DNA-binding NtrC family response regulator